LGSISFLCVKAGLAFTRTGFERRTSDVASAVALAVAVPIDAPRTALLSICARCAHATSAEIERAWTEKRSIVWVPGMRGAKFLVARELAPAMHGAFRLTALDTARASLRDAGVDVRAVDAAELRVLDVLRSSAGPLTYSAIASRAELDARVSEGAVSMLAAGGMVLCAGRVGGWRSSMPLFDLVSRWLPDLRALEPRAARVAVTRAYLASFGPATIDDLVFWSGFTRSEARESLKAVEAVEKRGSFDVKTPQRERVWPAREVRFVPSGDPVFLAWKNRERLVSRARVKTVYPDSKKPAPIIAAGGRIVGTWTFRSGRSLWGESKVGAAVEHEWSRIRDVVRAAEGRRNESGG
jgi:hypothetical protein